MKRISGFFITAGLLSLVTACVVPQERPNYQGQDRSYYQGNDAYNDGNSFYKRIDSQQRRINKGIASGELTRKEADMLQDNLDWIKAKYTRMTADDMFTQREQEHLDKMLDKNNEMIYSKKHNPARQIYVSDIQDQISSQQRSIGQGIASGELTKHEAGILQENLNDIRKKYAKMKADGILTSKELEKLDNKLDENSKMLYKKEHNNKYDIRKIY